MAAKIYYSPFIPAFSGNGSPVPGARLFFFLTGTNTLAPIFEDQNLSISMANPVSANLAGKFPNVYLDDTITYRIRQISPDGVPLGDDIDPYIPGTALRGSPGGNILATGPFADLKSQSIPAGATLVQTSGPTRGVAVEDTTLTDADVQAQPRFIQKTANGRFFRRDENTINLAEVGLTNDPVNNTGAFNEALAYLKRFGNSNSVLYRGTPRLKLPAERFPLGRVNIKQTVIIEGDGVGLEGGFGTVIDFTPTGGFNVERADTLNGQLVGGETGGGDGTIIRNIALYGNANPSGRDDNPGVSLKARATLEQLYIRGFAGAGVRIVANSGGSGEMRGNANLFKLQDITCNGCFDGVYILGADANAGYGVGVNVNFNASCGVFDASFLGNNHIGYHSSGNGTSAFDGLFVMVSRNGIRYSPAFGADGLWSTTPPGTNSNVWKAFEAGGPIGTGLPEWYSGIPVKFGAAYATSDRNARSLWLGCYTEGTQAPPQIQWPSMAVGGFLGQVGDGMWLNGEQRALQALYFRAAGAFLDGERSAIGVTGANVPDFRFKPNAQGYVRADFGNNDGFVPLFIHGPGTNDIRGPNTFDVRVRLGLPGGGADDGFVNAMPTLNLAWKSIVHNGNRTAVTQPAGWTNVPGTTTWIPFGAQSA